MKHQTKQNQKNKKGFYYFSTIIGLLVITFLAYVGGWFLGDLYGDSRTALIPANESGSVDKDGNVYKNEEFNFELTLTDSWQKYKAETLVNKTEFGVGVVHFYLPTSEEPEFTDDPGYLEGYVNFFSISVYNRSRWEDPKRDKEFDDMYGEVIARNDKYVFVYSHLNGDPPADISRQAVLDMEKIAKSIELK